MKNNKLKERILEFLYITGVILLCIKFFLEKFEGFRIFDDLIALLFCLLFGLKIISQKYNNKQLIITLLSGLVSILTALITKEYVVFYTYLIIFASQNIDFKKIIYICFYTFSSLLLICSTVYIIRLSLGLNVPIIYRVDGSIRLTFYMNHPNIYSGIVLWCSAMFMYIKNRTLNIIHYIVLTIINITAFVLTDSRTSLIAFIFMIIIYLIIEKEILLENKAKKIAKYSFVILLVVSIVIASLYLTFSDNIILEYLNNILSQRLYLFSYAIKEYGFSLLPRYIDLTKKIPWINGKMDELFIDSLYARSIIKYGMIYVAYSIYISVNLINKKTEKREIAFILLFAIVGLMEKYISNAVIGFPLLFFGKYLWSIDYEKK